MPGVSANIIVRFSYFVCYLWCSFKSHYRRQQYQQEMSIVPTFPHLYEVYRLTFGLCILSDNMQVLLELEKEIEDSLPQFQEMLLSLR